MKITCLFFAQGKELTGTSQAVFQVPEGTTSRTFIHSHLLTSFPSLSSLVSSSIFSLNLNYLEETEDVPLHDSDEIALIPPLSGG